MHKTEEEWEAKVSTCRQRKWWSWILSDTFIQPVAKRMSLHELAPRICVLGHMVTREATVLLSATGKKCVGLCFLHPRRLSQQEANVERSEKNLTKNGSESGTRSPLFKEGRYTNNDILYNRTVCNLMGWEKVWVGRTLNIELVPAVDQHYVIQIQYLDRKQKSRLCLS